MRSRWMLVATVLVAALPLAGCSGSQEKSAPPTSAAPTPIGKLDNATLRLSRSQFCDRVSTAAVRRALAGEPEADQHWANGDPAPPGAGSSGDVTHELGCAWTGPAGATARAWLFARPVDAAFAQTLVRQAGRQTGCRAEPAAVFGAPALLQTCTEAGVQRVRRAGLFGDTWLTCELSGPGDVRPRLDAWCAAVVAAAR